jgi:predicted DNA-binding transcriptional regulator AlpA
MLVKIRKIRLHMTKLTDISQIPVLMTRKEVANLMQVDIATIMNWHKSNYAFPKPIRINERMVLYKKDEVLSWIDDKQKESN